MYKFNAILIAAYLVATTSCIVSAGLVQTHHVVHEPVLAKVGSVVHSVPSAVSHQSITQVHSKSIVEPILAHAVKTTIHAAPVVSAVHAAPVVHSVPVVHSLPVVHAAPVLKSIVSPPVAYTLHH